MIFPRNIPRNEHGDGGDGSGGGAGGGQSGGSQAGAAGSGGATSLLGDGAASAADAAATGAQAAAGAAAGATGSAAASGGEFNFASLIGADGKFVANYHEKLPEGLKEHGQHFAKYRDPVQALQHTLNLQQLLGAKSDAVVIPGPDGTPADWAPVLKRLGVPDSPEGYNLKVPDKLPDGVKVNPEELKEFAKFAHGLGLTPQQVSKLQEFDLGRATTQTTASLAAAKAQEEAEFSKQSEVLTKAWGNGNEATQKKALAERAAITFGFTPDEVKTDPLFRNARFVMTLARAGAAMSEDTLVKGADLNSAGGLKAKAQDVINNPNNPLYKKYWNGDEDVNSQVRNWMRTG